MSKRLEIPTISEGMIAAAKRIIAANQSEDAVNLASELLRIAPEINGLPEAIAQYAERAWGLGSRTGTLPCEP